MGSMKRRAKQIGKYSGAATFSTIVNICVRWLLSQIMDFHLSVIIAYVVGSIVNYVLSALFVFHIEGSAHHFAWNSFWRFMMVSMFGFIATFIFSTLARFILFKCFPNDSKNLIELAAHIIGLNVSFVCNYFGHSFFSFSKKRVEED